MTPSPNFDRSETASSEDLIVKPRETKRRNGWLVPLLIAAAAHVVIGGVFLLSRAKDQPKPAPVAARIEAPKPVKPLDTPATAMRAAQPAATEAKPAASSEQTSSASPAAKVVQPAASPVKKTPAKPAASKPKAKAAAKTASKAKSGKAAAKSSAKTKAPIKKAAVKPAKSKPAPAKKTQSLDLEALSKLNRTPHSH